MLYKIGQANEQKKFEISDKTFFKYFKIAHSVEGLKLEDMKDYVE
jgi:hypothetical protein